MKAALGKGLGALLPEKGREVLEIDVERIAAGMEQPRKTFRDDSLKELADSIKSKGIIQPLLVKRDQTSGMFMIIAGERRYRAARMAGLKKVPAIVTNSTPEDSLEIALIENIQREDLNPLETASAFEKLIKSFGLTQEQLSEKVGKDRATVANYLRLQGLPDEIKRLINEGRLNMGHAKAILSIEGERAQIDAAKQILAGGLSVRASEKMVKARAAKKPPKRPDPDVSALEQKLIRALGTKVKLSDKGNGKGSILIEYYSLEELDRLLDIMLGE